MHAAALISVTFSAALVVAQGTQDAPQTSGNPTGVVFEAALPAEAFSGKDALNGNIKGSIRAEAPPDGVGVKFTVHFENLPKEGGPFAYHLHAAPVSQDGNCTNTMGHLDPFGRGEQPPCDGSAPQTCQVGDLAGKHGKVTQDPFDAEYVDPFASLKEDDQAFFGSRSFVVHFGNTTRITCANFAKKDAPVSEDSDNTTSDTESMARLRRRS
ncbi:copper/zinc superoxide dismutase (SODC) domain-containing protein [Hirsutella rhossiliensis]|uniref:superoxide dismutase n=1 Tax=Hirsutella rhossiliensis TaxID=111463 RepID=A0A9P8MPK2_9HYPO|nr:copper/zinc superoxide dismutase (SODC) domain-containing protein [Hirsutella rhossiliensis]KAH0958945.1 copper/zinc superoxide dismutase (SODC) domain-containing protein [Hirsutella rhossiliensis]